MPKLKITRATAAELHDYAISLGYRDRPIPPTSKYELYRIESPESAESGENDFIFFYLNDRGIVTLYGTGAAELYDDYLEDAKCPR
jgi:hypothetical protein